MKKKLLICFAMVVCILGLTACGKEETENPFITKDWAKENAEAICENMAEQYKALSFYGMSKLDMIKFEGKDPADYALEIAGMDSYTAAAEEFGNFVAVIPEETEVMISDDKADVKVKIQGDKVYKGNKQRTATMEIVYTEDGVESISVSTDYDMSELMVKAALNTVLGMGTVFLVLILISLIISCFNFIPKIQAAFRKKSDSGIKEEAVSKTVTQIAAKEEEEIASADDLELIAVISAAIAASEGAASTDGYVVRSIIRRA